MLFEARRRTAQIPNPKAWSRARAPAKPSIVSHYSLLMSPLSSSLPYRPRRPPLSRSTHPHADARHAEPVHHLALQNPNGRKPSAPDSTCQACVKSEGRGAICRVSVGLFKSCVCWDPSTHGSHTESPSPSSSRAGSERSRTEAIWPRWQQRESRHPSFFARSVALRFSFVHLILIVHQDLTGCPFRRARW